MELPSKRQVLERLLGEGNAYVYLDPRSPEVLLPSWLLQQPQVMLHLGYGLAVPIPDLELDEDGFSATLSFNRTPVFCRVPWTSVFAIAGDDGRGHVFLESVPPEVRREIDRAAAPLTLVEDEPREEGEDEQPTMPPEGGRDNVIPLWPRGLRNSDRPSQPPPKRPTDGGGKPRPPHLRRVK